MKATPICRKRLLGEIKLLNKDPHKYIDVAPDEKDILIWYFLVKGPEFSDFKNGYYIGKILHNPEYPLKPPDFLMLTPNGRFNINAKICLSNSSYHPDEWSAMWNIHAILTGFLSIMLDDKEQGISHIKSSKNDREQYAKDSIAYNKQNHMDIIKRFTRFMDNNGNPQPENNITTVVNNQTPTPKPEIKASGTNQTNEEPPKEVGVKAPKVEEIKAPKEVKVPEADIKVPDSEVINKTVKIKIETEDHIIETNIVQKKNSKKDKKKRYKANIKNRKNQIDPDNLVIEKYEKTDEEYRKIMLEHNSNKL